jgi:hypothetical protein
MLARMKPIEVPEATAPVAKQIDYVGKRLAQLLKPHQFARTSRVFRRPILTGKKLDVLQVFNLQGSKWNQGSGGEFCINVGVYFAPLRGTLKQFKPWGEVEELEPHECHYNLRIHELVPKKREAWWPNDLTPGRDSWFHVGPKLDLLGLGDSLCRVVETYLLPWFADRASIESLALGLSPTTDVQRAVALALVGRREEALEHAAKSPKHVELHAWLKGQ